NSEQQLPQRIRGLFNLVKQKYRKPQLLRVPLAERLLRQQRMSLAMPQISRRRANQLGDLMRVLKLRTVDLDAGARIAKQRLRHRLHYAGLARTCRSEEQQIGHRTSLRIQSRQKRLVDLGYLFDGLVLANDVAMQSIRKLGCICVATCRI